MTGRSPQKPTGIDGIGSVITSSPSSSDHRVALLVEGLRGHAEAGAGDLPAPHRLQRAALHDAGADVGAAAAHVEQHRGPELLVDPAVALGGQRAAGRADLPDPGQVVVARPGSGPACGRPSGTRGSPPSGWRRSARPAPTASPGRGTAGCRRSARSTRPPAGRRPARSTSSRRWWRTTASGRRRAGPSSGRGSSGVRAGCRRGRARWPSAARWCRRRTARTAGGRTAPDRSPVRRARPAAPTQPTTSRQLVRAVGHVHDVLDGRQPGPDLGDLGAPVDVLGAVAVAGDGQQHRRLDLAEPVDRPSGRRTRARRTPRPRPGWRWPGTRPRSPGCWAGRRPPGRRGRPRAAAARPGPGRPGRAAAPRSAAPDRGSASGR